MEIFNRIYNAVRQRGCISDNEKDIGFYEKLIEEVSEVRAEMFLKDNNIEKELIDVMTVCSSWLIHRGFDIEKLLIENAIKNENRCTNTKHQPEKKRIE